MHQPEPARHGLGPYLLSGILATIAFQMQVVAVGWQVYALSRSPLALGLVGLAEFLPALLLAFVVGHVVDRFNRRFILQICQVVRAVAMTVLAIATWRGHLSLPSIYLIVVGIGCANAFYAPSRQSILPALIPANGLSRALSWASAAGQASVICGPALGGLLYAVSTTAVYGTAAVLTALACLLTFAVPAISTKTRQEPTTLASIFGGVTYICSRPELLGAISLDLFAVLLGGATALLPIFAHDVLHTGPWGLGILRAAPSLGAVVMSLVLVRWPLKRYVGRVMFLSVAVFGVSTIVFAVSYALWLSVVTLIVLGAADSVSMIIRGSLIQLQTPDHMRGRVNSIYFIFVGTSNELGEFESGLTASWLGVVRATVAGGIGTVLVALLWMRAFPALLRHDRLE